MKKQRGFSLVIAVAVIALMVLSGMMVLDTVWTDTQLAGGDRGAMNAMYIAEAGAVWGKAQLVNLLYPTGSAPGASPLLTNLTVLTPLGATDVLCPENACTTPPCPSAIACSSYYLLTNWVPFGAGQYRVAATCFPSCTAANPVSYNVRAIGNLTNSNGSQRLIEVTLGP